jgi:hypothetical protein
MLGEYDATGTLIEETVWLGDTPVATLRPNGATAVALYYVHRDQLNTPRQISRPSENVAIWTWNSDPFGTDAANPNPLGRDFSAFPRCSFRSYELTHEPEITPCCLCRCR